MAKFSDIYRKSWEQRRDMQAWAAQVMRSPIGQESIRRGIASWLWDWCLDQKHPRQQLPSSLLDQLGKRDAQWQQDMAKAAAGSPGPLTNNECPNERAKGWANLGIETNQRREKALAIEYS